MNTKLKTKLCERGIELELPVEKACKVLDDAANIIKGRHGKHVFVMLSEAGAKRLGTTSLEDVRNGGKLDDLTIDDCEFCMQGAIMLALHEGNVPAFIKELVADNNNTTYWRTTSLSAVIGAAMEWQPAWSVPYFNDSVAQSDDEIVTVFKQTRSALCPAPSSFPATDEVNSPT